MYLTDEQEEILAALYNRIQAKYPNMAMLKNTNYDDAFSRSIYSFKKDNDLVMYKEVPEDKKERDKYQTYIENEDREKKIADKYCTIYNDFLNHIEDDLDVLSEKDRKTFYGEFEEFMQQVYDYAFKPEIPYYNKKIEFGYVEDKGVSGFYQRFSPKKSEPAYGDIKNELMAKNQYTTDGIIETLNNVIGKTHVKKFDILEVKKEQTTIIVDNYLMAKEHLSKKNPIARFFSFAEKRAIANAEAKLKDIRDNVFGDKDLPLDAFVQKNATIKDASLIALAQKSYKITKETQTIKDNIRAKFDEKRAEEEMEEENSKYLRTDLELMQDKKAEKLQTIEKLQKEIKEYEEKLKKQAPKSRDAKSSAKKIKSKQEDLTKVQNELDKASEEITNEEKRLATKEEYVNVPVSDEIFNIGQHISSLNQPDEKEKVFSLPTKEIDRETSYDAKKYIKDIGFMTLMDVKYGKNPDPKYVKYYNEAKTLAAVAAGEMEAPDERTKTLANLMKITNSDNLYLTIFDKKLNDDYKAEYGKELDTNNAAQLFNTIKEKYDLEENYRAQRKSDTIKEDFRNKLNSEFGTEQGGNKTTKVEEKGAVDKTLGQNK